MIEIAPGLHVLTPFPRYLINVYLLGDVLLDAAVKISTGGLLRSLKGHTVRTHALTHVHPDHQGSSHALCEALNIPLWCSDREAAAMEAGDLSTQIPQNLATRLEDLVMTGPGHPVARGLCEGDMVADFTVIEAPGHSPGHLAYWRERDRVLIMGDVLLNMDMVTLRRGLRLPPEIFTVDPMLNRASARKLAALNPRLVCFGHGAPLLDMDVFHAFVEGI